jgi:spore maturation protein CgeB
MLILYCGMKYDYGRPEQSLSFEHHNFYDSLVNMGHDMLYFDFMTLLQQHGKGWMNQRLLEVARSEKPALMFTILFTDEVEKKTVRAISESGETTTLNWFCDDHWRFDSYSRDWAPCFNWIVTTAASALQKYHGLGYNNVIKSQWACNHFLYRKLDLPLEHDVTFVGQPHGTRRAVIESIRQAGIDVRVWGNGWELGRITQEEMLRVFNQSRINLNLSNASVASTGLLAKAKGSISATASRALRAMPGGSFARRAGKSLLSAGSARVGARDNCADTAPMSDQIKGRNFEVPGCGGFLLTGRADNLEEYYRRDEEVACFDSTADLVEQIRFYLANEEQRNAVAVAGYQRTLEEHTYAHRFSDIFKTMGLAAPASELLLAAPGRPGVTREIT